MKYSALFRPVRFFPISLLLTLFALFSLQHSYAFSQTTSDVSVLHVTLEGGISPAQVDLIDAAISQAEEGGQQLIAVSLNTPGGLVSSMRGIVQSMLNSSVPVLVWVGPSGGRAASAGVFIVAASAFSGMAPQTTIGAASPVSSGGKDIDTTMQKKVLNDLMSFVRASAEKFGRNVQWYEKAVKDAVSITSTEAVMQRVVEVMASDISDFLVQAGARGVTTSTGVLHFSESGFSVVPFEAGFRYKLLKWLLDPQIAYMLFLAGIACLFFEFTHPGAILPGVLGAFSLLMGLYALSILPANATGLLLIALGLVLFVLELKIPSHGLLSIGAVASFFIGSIILFPDQPEGMTLPLRTILATTLTISVLMGGAAFVAVRALRSPMATGMEAAIGQHCTVKSWENTTGRVLYQGTLWNARCDSATGCIFEKGQTATVTAVDGLTLIITGVTPTGGSNHG